MDPSDIEAEVFAFLCQKYVQRADARQKSMGLQYTEAETHGLAADMAKLFVRMAPRLQEDEADA
jgi:hypothetical protein